MTKLASSKKIALPNSRNLCTRCKRVKRNVLPDNVTSKYVHVHIKEE